MKNRKYIIITCVIAVILLLLGFAGFKAAKFLMDKYHYLRDKVTEIDNFNNNNLRHYDFDYSWMDGKVLIAHAFGGKGSKTYTNALEAFEYNYDLGHRVFEVDFDLTDDDVTICSHDEEYWRYITGNEDSDVEYTYEVFKNTPLFTDYTPMDYMDVVNLLNEYPDIYIITDTKYYDELNVYKQFSQIVNYALEVNPEVLDRIIPQIYTKDMLNFVMNVYGFKSIIFTLYQIQWDAEDIAKFCYRSGIRFITISQDLIDSDCLSLWESLRLKAAVHTVDDKEEADNLLKDGVDMLYTNYLEPSAFVSER